MPHVEQQMLFSALLKKRKTDISNIHRRKFRIMWKHQSKQKLLDIRFPAPNG